MLLYLYNPAAWRHPNTVVRASSATYLGFERRRIAVKRLAAAGASPPTKVTSVQQLVSLGSQSPPPTQGALINAIFSCGEQFGACVAVAGYDAARPNPGNAVGVSRR
jgi:hypothetical protein